MTPNIWLPEDFHRAYWFAARAHHGQPMPDTDLPYLIHVSLVTMEVIAALRVEAAAERALLTGACRYKSVESILKNSLDQVPLAPSLPPPSSTPPHDNIRGSENFE